jgi:hypothetical protein
LRPGWSREFSELASDALGMTGERINGGEVSQP